MKQYFVYILECSDGSYYTGISGNLEQRLIQHDEGRYPDCYTFSRRPLKLVFQQEFNDVVQAIAFEKQVKGWSRKKKQAIISGQWELLPELAKSKKS
ncbi:GIY-YIG nuclease family protein [Cruoricaptor ignavus]|uniref:GIY-YIG nuclease family protein n=1 Tax=Cruoricaptor ignavus TaxID=1118202 RepID=A0A7M1T1H7_9FLAO|nr:GIY-YIG nuclease family protein [Cruoricaptor ignavus]QOR73127.1 GIY-YIG nuclease family protein [Cruoricaptor ignavus]